MIGAQPTTLAAITAERPTPPAPKMAIDSPACGSRTFITAPAPVWTPQPSGPSSSSGASSRTLITLRSWLTEWVAKEDWPKKCEEISPCSPVSAVEPSKRRQAKLPSRNRWQ